VEPETGRLASGAVGRGRLADPDHIVDVALGILLPQQDLSGKGVVVTAGPTEEPLDPVRHIGNRSTGKMGFALAERAARRGADVVLISGRTSLEPPPGIGFVRVDTTETMLAAVLKALPEADLLLMAAAPADYRPSSPSSTKMKKDRDTMTLELIRTSDILGEVKKRKAKHQGVVGFALETEDELEHARKKLADKDLDLIVVNNPNVDGAGFGHDTNVVSILSRSGRAESLERMPKSELADVILSMAASELGWKEGEAGSH
jgi:phosphopantothenoylcysteine decarboxylase/phosphopantothenate--cysteine ligase